MSRFSTAGLAVIVALSYGCAVGGTTARLRLVAGTKIALQKCDGKISVEDCGQSCANVTSFSAQACDREYMCRPVRGNWAAPLAPDAAQIACEETAGSTERVTQAVVFDRLALQTGCGLAQIKLTSKSRWRQGTEQAYRLVACGKPYICTTAAGRTDCKAAEGGPAAAPAAPEPTTHPQP